MYQLRLYIAGQSPRSQRALAELCDIYHRFLPNGSGMTVVDVLESPDLAEEGKILVTPTLVRLSPPPERRIVGDLSDQGAVLRALDIGAQASGPTGRPEE